MALLVTDLNDPPDGKDEIVFANLTDAIHPVSSPLYAWVTILRESAGSLIEVGRFPVGYAASGLAAADLDGDQQGLELVITTIEGDLVVLDLTTDGQFNGVHHRRGFAGAIGNYSSIHIGDHVDLSGATPAPGADGYLEIYFAGTMGVRRLDEPVPPGG